MSMEQIGTVMSVTSTHLPRAIDMLLRDYFAAKVIVSLATYEEYPPERAPNGCCIQRT
jgi:hypothetical protein